MPSVAEAATAKGPLATVLATGLEALSQQQIVTFTKYVRVVLPLDGFVFWIKASIVSPSALLNASRLNQTVLNQPLKLISDAPTITIKGSLHYSTDINQNIDETVGVNHVVFTAESLVEDFNDIGPSVTYIAELGPNNIKYAFSSRAPFYQQAGLYHYSGIAVYPAMLSQIIDDPRTFDRFGLVVSNSLPAWLAMANFQQPSGRFGIGFPLFPSFAVPQNIEPPYCAVHVDPEQTLALQSVPFFDSTDGQSQLARDEVKLILYGVRNETAQAFLASIIQYSINADRIGIMNMPIIRDDKRTQSELNILAMKKTITVEVSYVQSAIRDVARQVITDATIAASIDMTSGC